MIRIACGVFCLLVSVAASADDVRDTLTKASRFLQDDMQNWRTERKCGACHHGPLAMWTLSELNRQQVAVDTGYLANLTDWVRTDDNARLLPKVPPTDAADKPALSLPAVYLSFAVNAMSDRSPEIQAMRQRIVRHLQATQAENGSWTGPAGRYPVMAPLVEVTLLALVAWQPHRSEFPELPVMLDKAATWIATQPVSDSHQELALRLMWSAMQSDRAATDVLAQQLLALQQPGNRSSRSGRRAWRQPIRRSSTLDSFCAARRRRTARGR
jgi:hypothetical protein